MSARDATPAPAFPPRVAALWGGGYALLVLLLVLARAEPFADAPLRAGKLVELVAPEALRPAPGDGNLLVPWLLGADDGAHAQAEHGALFAGLLPLLLAALAFAWTSGWTARLLRAALLATAALAFTGVVVDPWLPEALPLLVALLAGLGLAALLRRDDERRGAGVPMAVGTASVALAGVLGAAAAAAGARTADALVAPISERLLARGHAQPDAAQVRRTAAHLVDQLDLSALAAMLAMLALLVLLKSRGRLALLLVVAVTAADLQRERLVALLTG